VPSLLLACLLGTGPAQAEETNAPVQTCQREEQVEVLRAQESALAAQVNAVDRGDKMLLTLLAKNSTQACRIEAYQRFWQEVGALLGAEVSTFPAALARLRALLRMRDALEATATQRHPEVAGGVPNRSDLLISELVDLRRDREDTQDKLERTRRKLDEANLILVQARAEIAHVSEYQAEVQRLRSEVARLQSEKAQAERALAVAKAQASEKACTGRRPQLGALPKVAQRGR
jgi:hypothetical protein